MLQPHRFCSIRNYPIFRKHIFQRYMSATTNTAQPQATPNAVNNQPTNESSKQEKLIKVAVVGVPNAGKSTFINNLINHRVSEMHKINVVKCNVKFNVWFRYVPHPAKCIPLAVSRRRLASNTKHKSSCLTRPAW